MKEYKAKILTYCGHAVDERLLEDGIYTTATPFLREEATTLGGMIVSARNLNIYPIEYFDNLAKCELVDVTVIVHEKSDGK